MGSLGELAATLRLNGASQMQSGLRGVGGAVSNLTGLLSAVQGPLALLGVSFAAFKGVSSMTDALKDVFESGRSLSTLSRITGESAGNLKMLQGAFAGAGLEAGQVPETLRALQKSLGGVSEAGEPTAAVFSQLGLSIQTLKGESAAEQLRDIGTAINKLPDQSSKAAASMKVFGRSGADMLALFSDPEALTGLGKGMSAQAQIFERQAGTFSKITADLQVLSGKTRGFFVGVADQVAPVLLPLLESIKNIDLVHLGQQAGGAVRLVAGAFQQGRLGDLIGASLKVGVGEGINYLAGAIPPVASLLGELIKTDLEGGIDAMVGAFDGLFDIVEGGLLKAFESPVRYLQAGIESVMQTAQYLADKASGKKDDDSGLGNMTDAQRTEHYERWRKVRDDRARQLARGMLIDPDDMSQKEANDVGAVAARDETYKNADREYLRARYYDPSKYARMPQTTQEIMAAHANEPVRFGPGEGRTADQLIADGGAKTKSSFDQIIVSSGKVAEAFKKAAGDIHSVQIVDTTKDRDTIASIGASLASNSLADGVRGAVTDKLASVGNGFGGAKMPEGDRLARVGIFEGDRLARIGGMIGGGGGPALDFHRRTASATERVAQGIQTLLQRWTGGDKSSMAVWAA